MATFQEFDVLSEDMCNKVHDFNTDTFKWYLTNTQPDTALDLIRTDLPTELGTGNGYTSGAGNGMAAAITFSRSGPTTTVSQSSPTVLNATGSVGPFRYAALLNDSTATPLDALVGWIDHGSSITLNNGDTYTIPSGARFTVN